jgi:hypothetical protein
MKRFELKVTWIPKGLERQGDFAHMVRTLFTHGPIDPIGAVSVIESHNYAALLETWGISIRHETMEIARLEWFADNRAQVTHFADYARPFATAG